MLQRFDPHILEFSRDYPRLFRWHVIFRARGRPAHLVSKSSELVLDGFPRSANSFAYAAFRRAQGREVSVAHHYHHEAQIALGVRWGLPVVIPIREPNAACLSLAAYNKSSDLAGLAQQWIDFHRRISPYKNDVIFASFDDITKDFGAVIEKVNKKFGTQFKIFDSGPESVAQVKKDIQDFADQNISDEEERMRQIAMPNQERARIKKELLQKSEEDKDYQRLIVSANKIYKELVGGRKAQ